ncbi:MAG TPA: hypothetical protein DEA85_02250 [Firmicutes bacterium]|nr:hypothetical protein [Bacillota bacterium]
MGRKIIRPFLLSFLVLLLLLAAGLAQAAQERILSYDTLVKIQENASVTVTEIIQVESAGNQIRRGIYRDIPTTYKDSRGNRVRVDFSLLSVLLDGNPEPYTTERLANGIRIRIGQEDVLLSLGQHTYTITYKVKRVLGFFEEHDELYWNVTGNGWAFPIESASATVTLPPGAPASNAKIAGFTGYTGATGSDYRAEATGDGVKFTTTRALAASEGLTIVVGWPKGYVNEPSSKQKLLWFLKDNLGILFCLLTLILLPLWYLYAWNKVGRDPRKGVIFPRYTPPEGFSPAAIRYIRRMGYDDKAFTAAIINLAVQGRLIIRQDGKKKYSLENTGVQTPSSPAEDILHSQLFSQGNILELDNANHMLISTAGLRLHKQLAAAYKGKLFKSNTSWLLLGILMSFILLAVSLIFTVLFGGFWGMLLLIVSALGVIIICAVFGKLLKAPTVEGRKLMDEIEGFKMFLEVAEKDYLQWSAPPERTPELFEKYLPHALALGVDQQWAEKFSTVLAAASQAGQGYRPIWYQGSHFTGFSAASLASNLSSSLNNSIAASKMAPGSSSGFSGGSSGGGGGGGGGGGW